MEQEYKQIENLIERFFDGETTNQEEQQLYDFFSKEDVPEYLWKYKSVFGYFETGITKEVEKNKNAQLLIHPKRKSWITWVSVAATLLVLLSIRLMFTMQKTDFDPFEGSYIIRNGIKITDMHEIKPELEKTLMITLFQQERADRMLQQLYESETYFLEIEQNIERKYCEIINQFSDNYAREEAKKILDIDCDHL